MTRLQAEPLIAGLDKPVSQLALGTAFYRGLVSTDRQGERWHLEKGIPLIPWSSQARGFFTGQYTPQMRDDPSLVTANRLQDGVFSMVRRFS